MKTILSIILSFSISIASSQCATEIYYCHKEKSFTNYEALEALTPGDFFQIIVTGINPNKVAVQEHTVASDKDAIELKNIFPQVISALGGSISPLNLVIPKTMEVPVPTVEKADLGFGIIEKLEGVLSGAKDYFVNWGKESVSPDEIKCVNSAFSEQRKITSQLNEYLHNEIDLEKRISDVLYQISIKLNFGEEYDVKTFEADMEGIDQIKNSIYAEKNRINNAFKSTENYGACFAQISSEAIGKLISANETKITTQVGLIHKELDKMLVAVSDSTKFQFKKLHDKNFKITEREVKLAPIRFDESLDSLSISFVEKSSNKLIYKQQLSFPIKLYQKKLRFSGQVFLSNLGSESYSTYFDESGCLTPVKEHKHLIEFGVSTGVNYIFYGEKINKTIGLSIGGSYSDKIRSRVLMNGGLVLGDKNQMFIAGGVIFGYRDEISNIFNDPSIKIMETTPVTVSKFNARFQIGIGYFL